MPQAQTFENHARVVPAYHVGAFGIFVINLAWTIYRAATNPSGDTVVGALLAIAFILLFFYARVFALRVQDRVIRLEMRLRLASLLPPDLQPRINDLSVGQLVALRFASDDEIVALTRTVLTENLQDRKAIKRMVKNWQADYLRA
jgi:hypothetical protein